MIICKQCGEQLHTPDKHKCPHLLGAVIVVHKKIFVPGMICPFCEEPIEVGHLKNWDGDDWLHLGCDIAADDDLWAWGYDGD